MTVLSASDEDIDRAAESLRRGLLVAFPTETVYGLGADAFNPAALARVFEAKGRPRFDPLIVHIASLDAVFRAADPGSLGAEGRRVFETLAARLWPGPLTMILPRRPELPDLATSGLPTVALRFPSHPAAQKLILRSTGAVAAPSANRFGRLSPTCADHVRNQLGNRVDIIIDGGPSQVGVESTVLYLSPDDGGPPRILRPGGVSREAVEALIGPVAGPGEVPAGGSAPSPGMLKSHYAPETPLYLHDAEEMSALPRREGEGYLFFCGKTRADWEARNPSPSGGRRGRGNVQTLSEPGDCAEAASRLFSALHGMDALGLERLHAEAAPDGGLGPAINDRLGRAQLRPAGAS